ARLPDRLRRAEPAVEPGGVELSHPLPGRAVLDIPQADDQRPHAGDLERPSQAEHSLAGTLVAESRVATGEHGPLDAGKIQRGDLLGGENPVVLARRHPIAAVGAGEDEAREMERVLP